MSRKLLSPDNTMIWIRSSRIRDIPHLGKVEINWSNSFISFHRLKLGRKQVKRCILRQTSSMYYYTHSGLNTFGWIQYGLVDVYTKMSWNLEAYVSIMSNFTLLNSVRFEIVLSDFWVTLQYDYLLKKMLLLFPLCDLNHKLKLKLETFSLVKSESL